MNDKSQIIDVTPIEVVPKKQRRKSVVYTQPKESPDSLDRVYDYIDAGSEIIDNPIETIVGLLASIYLRK